MEGGSPGSSALGQGAFAAAAGALGQRVRCGEVRVSEGQVRGVARLGVLFRAPGTKKPCLGFGGVSACRASGGGGRGDSARSPARSGAAWREGASRAGPGQPEVVRVLGPGSLPARLLRG